jgi:anti-sigma factor RsiW
MPAVNDISIMRYVDWELDHATAQGIEQAIADDPQVRARFEVFRRTRDLIRLAAQDAEGSGPSLAVGVGSDWTGRASPAERGGPRWLLPLAASVAIFVAGGVAGSQVQKWLLPGGTNTDFLSDIAGSYDVFAQDGPRTVELGPDQQPRIERWFARRLEHAITLPNLSRHGLTFGGGRLLAHESKPLALVVYYTADKKPVGLLFREWRGSETAPATEQRGSDSLVFWTTNNYLHVLIGQADPAFLLRLVGDAGRALTSTTNGK